MEEALINDAIALKLAFEDTRVELERDIHARLDLLDQWCGAHLLHSSEATALSLHGIELLNKMRKIDGELYGGIDVRAVAKEYYVFVHAYEKLGSRLLEGSPNSGRQS
jgi:hypothetical protein